jgi:quercetin dioxygenase-like cupin family protein
MSGRGPVPGGTDRFERLGLVPRSWAADPGTVFGLHRHPAAKVLVCRSGSIRFTLEPSGETRELRAGDWIELPAGQDHAALAGPDGARCEEAFVEAPA